MLVGRGGLVLSYELFLNELVRLGLSVCKQEELGCVVDSGRASGRNHARRRTIGCIRVLVVY